MSDRRLRERERLQDGSVAARLRLLRERARAGQVPKDSLVGRCLDGWWLERQLRGGLLPAYVGLSLEAGNTWMRRDDISTGDLRKDGSLFFGVDTPLGPVYLATGFDEGGGKQFYLFLGRTF